MYDDASALWQAALKVLASQVSRANYDTWLEGTVGVRLDDDILTVGTRSEFVTEWLQKRLRPSILRTLAELQGQELTLRFEPLRNADESVTALHHAGGDTTSRPSVPRPRLRERYTFDNYIVGPGNRLAFAAAEGVAKDPGRLYNPLFIYGAAGLGKTHLLHAIGHFVGEVTPELQCLYVSVETFTNEFINALRDGNMRSFKDRYRSVDVLLIDDIQALSGREQTQEEFFYTFNALHDAGKQIIISSDRPPKAIATLEDRLSSRFEMGLITDIQPPDLETRIAILSKRARHKGFQIHDPEVLAVIAERVSSNVRALEGALNRVVAHASLDGSPITVDLAVDVLRDVYPADQGVVTVDSVQREVCRYYGITADELVGQKRTRRLVMPRQVAMYLTRELTDDSLPSIGRAFGGRDHSTVLYAVQKISREMTGAGDIYAAVKDLTTRLTGTS